MSPVVGLYGVFPTQVVLDASAYDKEALTYAASACSRLSSTARR